MRRNQKKAKRKRKKKPWWLTEEDISWNFVVYQKLKSIVKEVCYCIIFYIHKRNGKMTSLHLASNKAALSMSSLVCGPQETRKLFQTSALLLSSVEWVILEWSTLEIRIMINRISQLQHYKDKKLKVLPQSFWVQWLTQNKMKNASFILLSSWN